MWKRLPRYHRGKENQPIGDPVLIETTYDERQLEKNANLSNVHDVYPDSNARQPYERQESHDTIDQLPPLPFRSLEPDTRNKRVSDAPTLSSVYSQLTSPNRASAAASSFYSQATDRPEISPPSSPGPPDGDVSPVEETRHDWPSQDQQRAPAPVPSKSQIPVSRKALAGPTLASQSNRNSASHRREVTPKSRNTSADSNTRWDKYTGERTADPNRGLPGSFKPGSSFKSTTGEPQKLDSDRYRFASSNGPAQSFKERAAALLKKDLSIDTRPPNPKPPVEPWSKAVGRTAIVPDVKDTPASAPIAIPPRSSRRPSPGNTPTNSNPSSAIRQVHPDIETFRVSTVPEVPDPAEESIKPIVPLKAGRNSPPRTVASPARTDFPTAVTGPPSPTFTDSNSRTQTPTQAVRVEEPSFPQVASDEHQNFTPEPQHMRKVSRKSIDTVASHTSFMPRDPGNKSHFSWTTYATQTTYQDHSPPPSPPPPMPSLVASNSPTPATQNAHSILNRTRPIPKSDSPTIPSPVTSMAPVSRKPAPSSASIISRRAPSMISQAPTTMTMDKALPKPPPELESLDLLSSLEAQMDDLKLRRGNIQRLIRDSMASQNGQFNPMIASLAERRRTEQRVAVLRQELAEIGSQEHDVGLRLHRAWKRREKEDPNQVGSALWVRRVTS